MYHFVLLYKTVLAKLNFVFSYLRETSIIGKLLYLQMMVWSLGLRVLGMTSSPALMQVTIRLTSSHVQLSGQRPCAPATMTATKNATKDFLFILFCLLLLLMIKTKVFDKFFFVFCSSFVFSDHISANGVMVKRSPLQKTKGNILLGFFLYKICIGTKVLRKCEKQIIRKEQLFLKLNTEGKQNSILSHMYYHYLSNKIQNIFSKWIRLNLQNRNSSKKTKEIKS